MQLVDEIVVEGPLRNNTLPVKQLSWSQGSNKTLEWVAPQCGIAYIRVRVDLWLESDSAAASGMVFPTRIRGGKEGDNGWSGPLLGVSHDFEPCRKSWT